MKIVFEQERNARARSTFVRLRIGNRKVEGQFSDATLEDAIDPLQLVLRVLMELAR